MSDNKVTIISEGIMAIEGVAIIKEFVLSEGLIRGSISITENSATLNFEVVIMPPYPFQFHEIETIQFYNKELLDYSHVNHDGSICVHTPHNADLKSKIYYDVLSLKQWMVKYFINKETDLHYDHVITSDSIINQRKQCFLFTDIDHTFKVGDFGSFKYSLMSEGEHNNRAVDTYIVQHFKLNDKNSSTCKWSLPYQKLSHQEGIFVFADQAPTHHKRFIVENWIDMEPYLSQEFLKFLDRIKKDNVFKKRGANSFPIFVGYKIPNGETHWQCAIIDINSFPNYAEKLSNGHFIGKLYNESIRWVQTKNCSYKYFFGRGALANSITEKKILIIGIGAIGSMIATTLTRGGCMDISLIDYDIKEPENVCRSEYQFITGLNGKVGDLRKKLIEISPFIKVSILPEFMDAVKGFINQFNNEIKSALENYDYIFDCSADNDVVHILDSLQLESKVLSLSITNHAADLMCATKPDFYKWTQEMFGKFQSDQEDFYNPTGCWNPTFKASYNDINILVQYAIKHINKTIESGKSLRSFHLATDYTDGFTIKLNQY